MIRNYSYAWLEGVVNVLVSFINQRGEQIFRKIKYYRDIKKFTLERNTSDSS